MLNYQMVIPIIPIIFPLSIPIISAPFTYKSLRLWLIPPVYGQLLSTNHRYQYRLGSPNCELVQTRTTAPTAPNAHHPVPSTNQHPAPSTHRPFLIATLFALLKTSGFKRGNHILSNAELCALLNSAPPGNHILSKAELCALLNSAPPRLKPVVLSKAGICAI